MHRLFVFKLLLTGIALAGYSVASNGQTILRTGEGEHSAVVSLGVAADPTLQFKFGFASDEDGSAPSTFFDSFTVTLQDTAALYTAVYLTADATGVAWAPYTPGGEALEGASILRSAFTPINLGRGYFYSEAFQVSAPVPESMRGHSLNVYFDLFDNQNSLQSAGWFSEVQLVPEPGVTTLLLVGLAGAFIRFRKGDPG